MPESRITQIAIEALKRGNAISRTSQITVEAIRQGPSRAILSQLAIEVLIGTAALTPPPTISRRRWAQFF